MFLEGGHLHQNQPRETLWDCVVAFAVTVEFNNPFLGSKRVKISLESDLMPTFSSFTFLR